MFIIKVSFLLCHLHDHRAPPKVDAKFLQNISPKLANLKTMIIGARTTSI